MTTARIEQIVNQGLGYVNELNLSYNTTTALSISPGQCRDSTNTVDIISPNTLSLGISFNGIGGLDTGTIAASTLYNIYVLYSYIDSSKYPVVAIASLSRTTPFMPFGYTHFARIGSFRTNGSSLITPFSQSGNGKVRYMQYNIGISILASGITTSYTAVPLIGVPPIVTKVKIFASLLPGVAAQFASFSTDGTNQMHAIIGQVAAININGLMDMQSTLISSVPNIYYLVNNAASSLNLFLIGYDDLL